MSEGHGQSSPVLNVSSMLIWNTRNTETQLLRATGNDPGVGLLYWFGLGLKGMFLYPASLVHMAGGVVWFLSD